MELAYSEWALLSLYQVKQRRESSYVMIEGTPQIGYTYSFNAIEQPFETYTYFRGIYKLGEYPLLASSPKPWAHKIIERIEKSVVSDLQSLGYLSKLAAFSIHMVQGTDRRKDELQFSSGHDDEVEIRVIISDAPGLELRDSNTGETWRPCPRPGKLQAVGTIGDRFIRDNPNRSIWL
ncbi:hypothetical protein P152DRAFT_451971 [Eremomyces bilateralis CBS 781.70]|uniref:Uncharacterized protein n=1 Tax=Eremomyces bilateralis CBS 781.70 TaxID=1392243 RepID=A0A6G1FUR8_9PEZI|nr:uncharacterized protein P152DRAFT_451971 [Eremomyces bilateralis CBS 781.70]KAF1809524.1 hypothetical protein P152DRAFT_451971 [Eremomyces bilateralis CBS 781.70]